MDWVTESLKEQYKTKVLKFQEQAQQKQKQTSEKTPPRPSASKQKRTIRQGQKLKKPLGTASTSCYSLNYKPHQPLHQPAPSLHNRHDISMVSNMHWLVHLPVLIGALFQLKPASDCRCSLWQPVSSACCGRALPCVSLAVVALAPPSSETI